MLFGGDNKKGDVPEVKPPLQIQASISCESCMMVQSFDSSAKVNQSVQKYAPSWHNLHANKFVKKFMFIVANNINVNPFLTCGIMTMYCIITASIVSLYHSYNITHVQCLVLDSRIIWMGKMLILVWYTEQQLLVPVATCSLAMGINR